jgi:hypothetical protein
MNFVELMEFLRASRACRDDKLKERLKLQVFDTQTQGYAIYTDANVVNESGFPQLKKLVKARNLKIRQSNGRLMIYTPRET